MFGLGAVEEERRLCITGRVDQGVEIAVAVGVIEGHKSPRCGERSRSGWILCRLSKSAGSVVESNTVFSPDHDVQVAVVVYIDQAAVHVVREEEVIQPRSDGDIRDLTFADVGEEITGQRRIETGGLEDVEVTVVVDITEVEGVERDTDGDEITGGLLERSGLVVEEQV